jgi:hypothetical protein
VLAGVFYELPLLSVITPVQVVAGATAGIPESDAALDEVDAVALGVD